MVAKLELISWHAHKSGAPAKTSHTRKRLINGEVSAFWRNAAIVMTVFHLRTVKMVESFVASLYIVYALLSVMSQSLLSRKHGPSFYLHPHDRVHHGTFCGTERNATYWHSVSFALVLTSISVSPALLFTLVHFALSSIAIVPSFNENVLCFSLYVCPLSAI